MATNQKRLATGAVRFLWLLLALFGCAQDAVAEWELTFFGWSDQHVTTDGRADHLLPAIDAMNNLPGTAYPASIGGEVAKPAFVFGCGDITEWPTHAAKSAYEKLITQRLKYTAYDVMGNHDDGGKVPSETMRKFLISRHGSLSYTFQAAGIQFIAVYSEYDESLNSPAQPLSQRAIEYVRDQLASVRPGMPVIIATHLCFDAMTNRDALVDATGNSNVIAILGGHYHKAKIDRYRDRDFIQLPSPAPNSPSEVMVFRVTSKRLAAFAYDYERRSWSTDPRKTLITSLQHGPPK